MILAAAPYRRLAAYYFCHFAFAAVQASYFTLYLDALSFSASEIAVLLALMPIMRALAPNLWGWLAERQGRCMPIVRLAAVAGVLGFALLFWLESFWGVLFALAVMTFFWSAALPLVETVTFAHLQATPGRYGQVRVWGSLGFIVAVLFIGHVLDHVPVDALLVVGVLILLALVGCAFLVPDVPPRASVATPVAFWPTVCTPRVRLLLTMCFLMSATHGVLYFFYSLYLVQHGYSPSEVGWMWTVGVVAEIVVFMGMPRLWRHVVPRTVLAVCLLAAALRFVLIGVAVDSFALLLFAQVLHGLTFGAWHAAAIALVDAWFGEGLKARGQSLYGSVSFGAGNVVGGVLAGVLWDHIGAQSAFVGSALFALAGAWCLVRGWDVLISSAPATRVPAAVE